MTFPLDGIRVLDLSQAVSGPYAGRVLADLGADVVKVSWPRGDITSFFGAEIDGRSGLWLQMNAGKRGLALDHTTRAGAGLVRRLAARSDVVIENFRPGVLDRAGLGYETLAADNPRLVMLSISGFGGGGPESDRQAYAPVIHAESGLLARQAGFDGREPTDVALALADSFAALHGAVAVLAALRLRYHEGGGQHIDLAMLDAMVATDDYTHYAIDEVAEPYSAQGAIFDATGGPILIAADAKTLWAKVSRHAGLHDPAAGADLATKIRARRTAVAGWIAGFADRGELVAQLVAAGLPWADIRTAATLLDSPTLRHRAAVAAVDGRGVVRMPYRFSAAESDVRRGAPRPDGIDESVLRDWLDLDDEAAASLRAELERG